jgi:spore coat polysaccharide biosynthesis protein SpsF
VVLAILQARTSSTRLPGKVLRPILGRPMLALQIERMRRARRLEGVGVATSLDPGDDAVAEAADAAGAGVFRGSREDVLSRYLGAIEAFGPMESVVRMTADCPLADPALIDEAVRSHGRSGADITTLQLRWTFPKGLDVEVVEVAALRAADRLASPQEREHVTAAIYARPGAFRINGVDRDPPLRFRWTVDTLQDFEFVRAVYEDLYPANPAFTAADVLDWQARHPEKALPYDPFSGTGA